MKSIRSIYKIGNGPSSSHTVGPYSAAKEFRSRYADADGFAVTLYGSLAMTGDGHGTANAIRAAIPDAEIYFDTETNIELLPHPNTMDFIAEKKGKEVGRARVMSIGGGSVLFEGEHNSEYDDIYPQKNFTEMLDYCEEQDITLQEFIYQREPGDIKEYLREVWQAMVDCVRRGLKTEGILPGGLNIDRKAKKLFDTVSYNESSDITMDRLISAFAYAVSEENASEGQVVTAPTCGSCGVIPSVLYYMRFYRGFTEDEIIDALAVAALIGNVISTNASISGAQCGCQAEIGSACSMAAGALAILYKMGTGQIEYAAEVSMEHNLGLTCDPVKGLVQIPCIERNAVAAMRAVTAVNLSRFLFRTRKISFDTVVETMYRTGLDMDVRYKETAHGGLAQLYKE
ncbi:MAG: L-serine ammonia-lyase, iron-sulfur-dependent, subunit alpha [Lachnospiraceae bacterium]|nr:L-serine ammonia-lyase, iron-sulfur-dependent, subunit alpha [Lachnospiraceae bacterium]